MKTKTFFFFSIILLYLFICCSRRKTYDGDRIYEQLVYQIESVNAKLSLNSTAPLAFFHGVALKKDTLCFEMKLANQEGVDLDKIYKENPDIMRNRAKNSMALSFATLPEIKDLILVALDSLNIIYATKGVLLDNSKQNYYFTTEELKDFLKDGYNKQLYIREILKSDLFFVNNTLPAVFDDEGNEIDPSYFSMQYLKENYNIEETIFMEENNIVYLYNISEKEMDVNEMAELYNNPEIQEAILHEEAGNNPYFKDVVERCAIAGMGMEYRFIGAKTGRTASVIYSNSLLIKVSKLPVIYFD